MRLAVVGASGRMGRQVLELAVRASDVELVAAMASHIFAVFASPLDYGEIVAMSQRYWQQRYDGARRLVGVVMPDLISAAHAEPATRATERSGAVVHSHR